MKLALMLVSTLVSAQVAPTFFGATLDPNLVYTKHANPVPVGSARIWDSGVNWYQIDLGASIKSVVASRADGIVTLKSCTNYTGKPTSVTLCANVGIPSTITVVWGKALGKWATNSWNPATLSFKIVGGAKAACTSLCGGFHTSYFFDKLISTIQYLDSQGIQDQIMTYGWTPPWCNQANSLSSPCGDVLTGDATWKGFISNELLQSVALSSGQSTIGKVLVLHECWNEFEGVGWTGTYTQMLTMCGDLKTLVKAVNPTAIIGTPSITQGGKDRSFLGGYLSKVGSCAAADAITYHGYPGYGGNAQDTPEKTIAYVGKIRALQHFCPGFPMWNTEFSPTKGGIGGYLGTTSDYYDLQGAYYARLLLWQISANVTRQYWYDPTGLFFDSFFVLNSSGIAANTVRQWLQGVILTGITATPISTGIVYEAKIARAGVTSTISWYVSSKSPSDCKIGLSQCPVYPGYLLPVGTRKKTTLQGTSSTPVGTDTLTASPVLYE